MSRHLVKEGNIIGWKENPTDEDYVLTYRYPNLLGWKQGPGERTTLTKDGELIGWRKIFSGEVMTTQLSSLGESVEYGWGNLPTGNNVLVTSAEGFGGSTAWNPNSGTYIWHYYSGGGVSSATFGVDVHLEIEFVMGDGPYPQMIYKGNVPAGTRVSMTGYSRDNFLSVSIQIPNQDTFGHYHYYEGMIEVRVTKL